MDRWHSVPGGASRKNPESDRLESPRVALLAVTASLALLLACTPAAPQPTPEPAAAPPPAAPATPAVASPTPLPHATPVAEPAAAPSPAPKPPAPAASPTPDVPVGVQVGQRAPEFTVSHIDGAPLSSVDLLAERKPFILYFFATWWGVCRAEFRLLTELYPRYAERVEFVAVGIDPSEGPEVLRAYRDAQGYPWEKFLANPQIVEQYRVVSTALKYAVDADGIITFQRGYGVERPDTWEQVFEELVAGS